MSSKAPAGNRTARKRHSPLPAILALIIVFAVIAAAAAYFILVAPVSKIKTIYPNVTVAGIDVGGLTKEDAAAKIAAQGVGTAPVQTLSVSLPLNVNFEIDTAGYGTFQSAEEMAEAAYNYGRSGSKLNSAKIYRQSKKSGHAISFESSVEIDDVQLLSVISPKVAEVNSRLEGEKLIITESYISILKAPDGKSLSEEEVLGAVREALITQDFSPITVSPDFNGTCSVDLDAVYAQVHREAVNATMDESTYVVTPEVYGLTFDLNDAKARLDAAEYGEAVVINLTSIAPEVTSDSLSSLLFRDTLSEITTTLTAIANRSNNVKLACQAVNGFVINPGESFSYNDVVGERTTARGYLPATAYAGGKVVQEVGGGICQVSSMIYYCAVTANMEINQRTNHRWMSGYVDPGMDATVSWGGPEFVFTNISQYPIKIVTEIDMDAALPSTVTLRLLGTNVDGSYAKFSYQIIGTVEPEEVRTEDPDLAPGEEVVTSYGSSGYIVDTYRTVYAADGTVISSVYEDRSSYHAHDREISVGPALEEADPTLDPTADPTEAVVSPDPGTAPEVTTEPGTEPSGEQEPAEPGSAPTTEPGESPPAPESENNESGESGENP